MSYNLKPSNPKGLARLPSGKSVQISVTHSSGDDHPDGNNEKDMNAESEKKYDEWQLKDAADTLSKAEEIKADKHLMTALGPHLEKKSKAYKSLTQLRNKAARLPKD